MPKRIIRMQQIYSWFSVINWTICFVNGTIEREEEISEDTKKGLLSFWARIEAIRLVKSNDGSLTIKFVDTIWFSFKIVCCFACCDNGSEELEEELEEVPSVYDWDTSVWDLRLEEGLGKANDKVPKLEGTELIDGDDDMNTVIGDDGLEDVGEGVEIKQKTSSDESKPLKQCVLIVIAESSFCWISNCWFEVDIFFMYIKKKEKKKRA